MVGGGMRECARAAGVGGFEKEPRAETIIHESVGRELLEIGFSYIMRAIGLGLWRWWRWRRWLGVCGDEGHVWRVHVVTLGLNKGPPVDGMYDRWRP